MSTPTVKRRVAPIADASSEDLTTRRRIKVAARRLFAERGVEAVTVRDIVAGAGAKNGGSLNYYFQSKDNLILELVSDILRESSDIVLDGISNFERTGGPKTVREVIAVLVDSYRPIEDPSPTSVRFLSSVLFSRRRMVREFMERLYISVYLRMLRYIELLRPDIPAAVLRQRWIYLSWYLVSALGAHESYIASDHRNAIWIDTDPIENMIDTATGLIEAPHTPLTVAKSTSRKVRRTSNKLSNDDAILA